MSNWYVLHVRSNYDHRVLDALQAYGAAAFSPVYKREWGIRYPVRRAERPLFPGYVFARLDLARDWLPALQITGVIRLLGRPEAPEAVPDAEIDVLQLMIISPYPMENLPRYQTGDVVSIERGAFAGVDARVERVKHRPGRLRIVVSIDLLGRSVAVEVDADEVRQSRDVGRLAA